MLQKISISYPPLISTKGTPCLYQNRQFQWFAKDPTFIFPVIPAYTATLLQSHGYQVIWDDAIAEKLEYPVWITNICGIKLDLMVLETKTPVVKQHWQIIKELKLLLPKLIIVLVGDHVTAFPEESLLNSQVDYVLVGGDYDFGVLNLVNYLNNKEKLKAGWRYKQESNIINSGTRQNYYENDLNMLPIIDRNLVKWELYGYQNGNFKYTPGTYTMIGRDCWWGQCIFCSWTTFFPGKNFRTQNPEKLLDEIENVLIPLGIKEVFDDSGSFPAGEWIKTFCKGMIERGLNKKIHFSCNMRFGALTQEHYELMAKANFRYILYGVESANQETLDKINKNLKLKIIEQELKIIQQVNKENKGNIAPHITTMIGFPWENITQAQNTVDFSKKLFKSGLIETLQCTIIIPYPGTPLYKLAVDNNWLIPGSSERERYDMREQVLISSISQEKIKELVQSVYKSFITPKFIFKKIISIRSLSDIKFLWKAGMKLINHLFDFKK